MNERQPPPSQSRSQIPRSNILWCECENCTDRWTADRDGVGTIRCPGCGSKNVDIADPADLEGE